MGQSNLQRAKVQKKDEFYTQLVDIENELKHYKDQLFGKIIFCNCDDPYESNFFKYFANKFNELGLKKLIATSYVKSPIVGGQLPLFDIEGLKPKGKEPYKIEINEVPDSNNDGAIGLDDVEYLLKHDNNVTAPLKGDRKYNAGDFRSSECIDLLKEADIIVTNPPFSLFREYVAQLDAYKKKFLIIGNIMSSTYRDVFKLLKENKIWLGYNNGAKTYQVPDDYEQKNVFVGEDGKKYIKMGNTGWFTNLDVTKRNEEIPIFRKYYKDPEKYPKYVNYNAIEVGKVSEIPEDYEGEMGVSVTFLDKHNSEQFELIGSSRLLGRKMSEIAEKGTYVQGGVRFYLPNKDGRTYKCMFDRIIIKNKNVRKD